MPDLQAADAGVLGVARLQRGDDAAGFVAQRARLVERRVVAFAHEAAVALEGGQLGGERGRQVRRRACRPACGRPACASAISAGVLLERAKRAGKIGGCQHAVADGGKIARAAAADAPAATARARDRARPASRERVSARAAVSSTKARDRVEPAARSAPGSVSGADKTLRQQARAGRGHRAVDRVEQRAAPFAGKRAHQFEIGARRLVDRHASRRRFAQRRRQRRTLADLRALDIGDAGRRGGQLEPRQRAEGLAGRDREKRRQPPLGGRAVEHVARQAA